MAEKYLEPIVPAIDLGEAGAGYSSAGHPSIRQLMAEQGTGPIYDVSVLHGNFWPEEESIAGRQLGRRRSLFGPGVEVSLAEDDGDEMRDIV